MSKLETHIQTGTERREGRTPELSFESRLDTFADQIARIAFYSGNWDHTLFANTNGEFDPKDAHAAVYDNFQPYFDHEPNDIWGPKDPIGTLHRLSTFILDTVSNLEMMPEPDFTDRLLHMQYEYKGNVFIHANAKHPGVQDMADSRWFVDHDKLQLWQETYVYPSEYLIYRSLAENPRLLHAIPEITDHILEAIRKNPEQTFGLLYTSGIDTLFPDFPMFLSPDFLDNCALRLREWEQIKHTKDGLDFFVEVLTESVGVALNNKRDDESNEAYARRIFQCIPHLDAYAQYNLKPYERQSDEFYMQIALASGEFSARSGRGPFGAVIVHPDGRFIIATNEIDPVTGQIIHAETVLMRKAYKYWRMNSLKNSTLYSTAEPCFGCAKEILHGDHVSRVVYGVPTTMGMKFFGISEAEYLRKLDCGIPIMQDDVLEERTRKFYRQYNYIDLIRPKVKTRTT